MSAGFDDLDEVLDEDGNVKDEADAPADTEDLEEPETVDEPAVTSDQTENSVESEAESADPIRQDGGAEAVQTGDSPAETPGESVEEPGPRVEAAANAAIVQDLAGRAVPGTDVSSRYPYVMRRGGWDDERSGNRKFVMRGETEEMEEVAVEEIKEELFPNTDLNITDIREAAYIVGLQNLDGVVDVLNQWGFAEQEEMRE